MISAVSPVGPSKGIVAPGKLNALQSIRHGNIAEAPFSLLAPAPDSLDLSEGYLERTALRVRTVTRAALNDDGELSVRSHSKLRFQYDFQAADGTRIQVRLKANVHYSQTENDDDSAQSLKIRVQLNVSILQDQVASDAAPLLDPSALPSEARDAIALALGLFQEATDAATSLFEESDPLDGDALIARVLDAFHQLVDSIHHSVTPQVPAENPVLEEAPVDLAAEAVEPPELIPVPTSELSPDSPTAIGEPESETETSAEEAKDPATGVAEDTSDSPETEPPTPVLHQSPETVVLQIRARVIESLTYLAGTFDHQPVDSAQDADRQTLAVYRNSISLRVNAELSAPAGNRLDTQV
jgi:hypothetical protein